MPILCPDHDVEATDACSDCGRAMCRACPRQDGAAGARCQSCQVLLLSSSAPLNKSYISNETFRHEAIKWFALIGFTILAFFASCMWFQSCLHDSFH